MPPISIPRFLLPQGGAIWRNRLSTPSTTSVTIRNASKKHTPKPAPKGPSKPLVLEKPTKFNPPSHGQRLKTGPTNYPGPQLSDLHRAANKNKKYPNMMPPDGTWMHWFIHNRTIHVYIALGTLSSMAITVWVTNFKRNSPFADLLPDWSQYLIHPIDSVRQFWEVLRLTTEAKTAETLDRRNARMDDVAKRANYRKAHGLDQSTGFGGWTLKNDPDEPEMLAPGIPIGDMKRDDQSPVAQPEEPVQEVKEKKQLKKWLGIW